MNSKGLRDEEPILISALQHYAYCPRQCALIHVEQTFDENIYTLRGHREHERVDKAITDVVRGERYEHAVPLWSDELGLTGRADVVVFRADGTPYPVEHKSGSKKTLRADEIQLCAQALCLEEMLDRAVPDGALFYRGSRRRREVPLDQDLREETREVIAAVRDQLGAMDVPPPVADERCPDCSLIDACMPYLIDDLQEETAP